MPDTVSIIRSKGKPLSVEAERKRHSDWVQQEAQILMDELFVDLHDPLNSATDVLSPDAPVDVEWVDGVLVNSASSTRDITQTWASLEPGQDEASWIAPPEETPFYRHLWTVLGGLVVLVPLSFWGTTALKNASQPRSVVAATPVQSVPEHQPSDQDFAEYAQQALRQIEVKPKTAIGATVLPTQTAKDRPGAIPPSLPVAPTLTTNASRLMPPAPAPSKAQSNPAPKTQASPADIDRLALRVFEPKAIQSKVPAVSGAISSKETVVSSGQSLPVPPNLSSITPAPDSDLPVLSANISEPAATIAAATPLNSPVDASKKVIGIVELGLQSTLMVSNNGSYLQFKVGDTVNDEGWKLVQIAQGKAILQNGTEYKTLSEGQYF